MFPLAGKKFSTSAEELESSLNDALAGFFELTRKDAGASVSNGGRFPKIKAVRIDLDDAAVTTGNPPPKPLGTGKREPGPRVDKFDLSAQPIRYENARLNLKLSATGLKFDFDRDRKGHPLLVLTDAKTGKVDAKISKIDLEELVREAATLAAKKQGVTIEDLDLELQSAGKRSAIVNVRVQAKKLVMRGVVVMSGRCDIDDELNATVSELSCTGEGVIGSTAAAFLKDKIKQYDGMTIPLMAFSLGDLSLRDLKIDVKKDLHVTATFGAA